MNVRRTGGHPNVSHRLPTVVTNLSSQFVACSFAVWFAVAQASGSDIAWVGDGVTLGGNQTVEQLIVTTGGTLSPGNSPGIVNAGDTIWTGAGNYNWQLYDATGGAGSGYDLLNVTGGLDVSTANRFNINLWTLSAIGPDLSGPALHFTNTVARAWTLVHTTGGILGFNADHFNLVPVPNNGTAGFANSLNGGFFTLRVVDNNLVLTFTPPIIKPTVVTQAATAMTPTNATFNATLSPNGAATAQTYFEYGTTTSYGSSSATNLVRAGLNFNGLDQSVSIPHRAGLNFTTAFTLEAWVQTTNGVNQYLATKNDDSFYLGIGPTGTAPGKAAVFLNGVTAIWLEGNSNVSDGRWHHLAAVYDGTAVNLYVDGKLEGHVARSGSMATGTAPVCLGSRGLSGYLGGALAEVRLWNAALGQPILQSYMNVGLTPSHPNYTQLRAYWSMNDQDGTVVHDASGNGNSGALAAGQSWTSSPLVLSAVLSGLVSGQTYHYRVVAANSAGTTVGNDLTFTTPVLPSAVTTLAATAVTATSATLNGLVNPNGVSTDAFFEYGLDANYGAITESVNLGNGTTAQAVSANLSGLLPGRTYHYRVGASVQVSVDYGQDMIFQTPVPAPTIDSFARQGDGPFQFLFNGVTGVAYQVYGSTNLTNWVLLGPALETPGGVYLFSDKDASNHDRRFYQIRWP